MRLGQIKTIISTPFRRVSTKLEGARGGGGGWWRVVIHEVTRLLGRLKSSISSESHKTVTSQSHAMSHGKQKVIQLNSTRSITTKYDRLVTCCAKEPLKEAKPFYQMFLRSEMFTWEMKTDIFLFPQGLLPSNLESWC